MIPVPDNFTDVFIGATIDNTKHLVWKHENGTQLPGAYIIIVYTK